jgi:SurA-like protein
LVTVTSVLRRVVAPFAAVTALVATMSACGTGPSQANSAVIIDGHVISVDEVQSLVDKVVKEPAARPLAQQHKLDLVAREVVTQLVTHRILGEVAREENLRVDESQLSQLREQNPLAQRLPTDGSVPTEQLVPILVDRARGFDAYANDSLLLMELAKKYLGRAEATISVAGFTDFGKAKALAEKIAARPDDGADLMRSAGTDGEPQLNVDTGPTMLALQLQLPKQTVLVVNQPGTAESAGGYYVVQVLSTKVLSSPSPEADSSQTDPNQLPLYGKYLLRERLTDEGIRLSPRYGAWNTAEMKAVPKSEADVTGMLLLPKNDKQ